MRTVAVISLCLTLLSVQAFAQNASEISNQCTNLAADPDEYYPEKNHGVALENIDVEETLPACLAAVAASHASPMDHYHLSRVYGRTGDTAKRIEELTIAASGGSAYTWTKLGVAYYIGDGVPKDLAKAYKLFSLGSSGGNPQAMTNLGVMEWNGEGRSIDRQEALRHTQNAAEVGYEPAVGNLKIMRGDSATSPSENSETSSAADPGEIFGDILLLLGTAAAMKAQKPAAPDEPVYDDDAIADQMMRSQEQIDRQTKERQCNSYTAWGDGAMYGAAGCN
ncbi:hypothetical protein GR204_01715 [Rhizobium leguminosarum]|uniref:Sel1 repeat family protein n=1 Tax=Rhizobium leguminosarum TaxID=384 RepID=A0A6P0B0V3_RHILE|nr:tetratricopeptide repeat protein [Rhizobium leguminosarum]NEI32731.1 hypothetical protein [Rhizobium leguminosarum]NEI39490.1 hypothetical protein [Rhizobium leguminosarum]